jgi:DNA-binding MarR family transcriptional regulator
MTYKVIIMHDKEEGAGGVVAPVHHSEALEEAVTQMISTLPRMFKLIKQQARSAHGGPMAELGDAQVWVLTSLASGSQLTSKLAHRHNVTIPTMTRIVDGLVEKEFVMRLPSTEDRRQIHLQLTEAGREAVTGAHEQFRAVMTRFVSSLSEKQLEEIALACKHLGSLLPESDFDYQALCPPKEDGARQAQDVIRENGHNTLTEAR